MQVEGSAAGVLGMKVHLPGLAQRIGLDEMAFVVDVEAVVYGMILEVGDETGNVDDRHEQLLGLVRGRPACHAPLPSPSVTHPDDPARVARVLDDAAEAIADALDATADWGEAGTRPGQHHSDLATDAAAVAVLTAAGYGVLSEESGLHHPERPITVVVDPLDGSTNASRRVSWWATSLCAVDGAGPLVSLVVDLRHGTRWTAVRGGGAQRGGEAIAPSSCQDISRAIVGLNGVPDGHGGWAQYRALGACALDLCAVADGTLDGYLDCTVDELAPWDYLGALLVCREAGVTLADAADRDLVVLDHRARRIPVAGATSSLARSLSQLHPNATH